MGKFLLGIVIILGIAAGVFGGLVAYQSWEKYNSLEAGAMRLIEKTMEKVDRCLSGEVSQCADPNTPILHKIKRTVSRKFVEQGMNEDCLGKAWLGLDSWGLEAKARYTDGFRSDGDGYQKAYDFGKFNKADGTLDKEKAAEWVIHAYENSDCGRKKRPPEGDL